MILQDHVDFRVLSRYGSSSGFCPELLVHSSQLQHRSAVTRLHTDVDGRREVLLVFRIRLFGVCCEFRQALHAVLDGQIILHFETSAAYK